MHPQADVDSKVVVETDHADDETVNDMVVEIQNLEVGEVESDQKEVEADQIEVEEDQVEVEAPSEPAEEDMTKTIDTSSAAEDDDDSGKSTQKIDFIFDWNSVDFILSSTWTK